MQRHLRPLGYRLACGLVAALLCAPPALAGDLDAFDRAAARKAPADKGEPASNSPQDGDQHHESGDKVLGDLVFDITSDLVQGVVHGLLTAALSSDSSDGGPDPDAGSGRLPDHRPGESSLPYARADLSTQLINSRITATDGRVEIGDGLVGLQARQTHFIESDPHETLTISQVHALLRLASPDQSVTVDVGVGALFLQGVESRTGFSATLPITLRPRPWLALHLRPTLSAIDQNTLRDYDGAVELTPGFVAVQLGYRYQKVAQETLSGPYLGLSLMY